eukprot:3279860-Rhodomonas_salina.1
MCIRDSLGGVEALGPRDQLRLRRATRSPAPPPHPLLVTHPSSPAVRCPPRMQVLGARRGEQPQCGGGLAQSMRACLCGGARAGTCRLPMRGRGVGVGVGPRSTF